MAAICMSLAVYSQNQFTNFMIVITLRDIELCIRHLFHDFNHSICESFKGNFVLILFFMLTRKVWLLFGCEVEKVLCVVLRNSTVVGLLSSPPNRRLLKECHLKGIRRTTYSKFSKSLFWQKSEW